MDSYTFKFTVEELNLILQGLLELPAKMSMNAVMKIQNEFQMQQQQKQQQPHMEQASSDLIDE